MITIRDIMGTHATAKADTEKKQKQGFVIELMKAAEEAKAEALKDAANFTKAAKLNDAMVNKLGSLDADDIDMGAASSSMICVAFMVHCAVFSLEDANKYVGQEPQAIEMLNRGLGFVGLTEADLA